MNYYNNKNIFITGGTGFVGQAIIMYLLHNSIPKSIYLLYRNNKSNKLENFLKSESFNKLSDNTTIIPIEGDLMIKNLGISDKDIESLKDNVEIIIHCAATINFNEQIDKAYQINTQSVIDLVNLAYDFKNLQLYINTSTAFSNVFMKRIGEKFYNKDLKLEDFPNTYTYTKWLTEIELYKHIYKIPIVICRPSCIIGSYKFPYMGWCTNYNTLGMYYFCSKKVIFPIVHGNTNNILNIIPIDICVENMLYFGMCRATMKDFNKIFKYPIINITTEDNQNYEYHEHMMLVNKYLKNKNKNHIYTNIYMKHILAWEDEKCAAGRKLLNLTDLTACNS